MSNYSIKASNVNSSFDNVEIFKQWVLLTYNKC